MVAKEKMLIFIATIIVIFIIAALVFPSFSNMLPLENPFLQGKDAFIRYYACSLAICTQGCNWLSSNSNGISNDICLKRNIWGNCTMTCKSEICDKQPGFGNCGNKGSCCNDTYSIYLSLKGNARFWSKNEYIPSISPPSLYGRMSVSFGFPAVYAQAGSVLHALTEIDNILENFNKKEKKPGFPVNIMSGGDCQLTPARFFSDIPIPPYLIISKKYGLFYKMGNEDPNKINDWSQRGSIYMLPNQAEPWFTCFGYDSDFGYSECTFKGYLQIYSWDPNNDNCADVVVINGQDPFTGDFRFYADNEGKAKIPIDHTGPIALYILNGLGFSETFTMQIIKPLPEGITCDFNGEDTTVLNVEDTKVGAPDVPLTCKPTALPPAGGFEVWVKAWDGTKTQAVKLKIDVGDFKLTLASPSPLIINVGNSGSFIFDLTNTIGIDVTFQLTMKQTLSGTQSIDNNVGCTFNGEITSIDVADSATKQITLNCAPNSNARNKDYDITVAATWDTTERTAVAKVTVPNCTVTNLALKFLDSSNTEIASATVNSADAVKLKADGFSGCQNMNVRFILSVGSKTLYENSVDTSGDSVYSNFFTANSPEKWEMYVQMDENDDETYEKESPRKNLTINAPTPAGYNTIHDQTSACGYGLGEASCCSFYSTEICDQCGGCIPIIDWHPVDDCNNCLDPQSCWNTKDNYASESNICCKSDNTYSPGLTDAPCLSPDTNTKPDVQTDYFKWRGVDNARNILVGENWIQAYYAQFNDVECGKLEDCYGGDSAPQPLKDLLNQDLECPTTPYKYCKFKDAKDNRLNWYNSWLYIQIAPTDESRPVYGIMVHALDNYPSLYSVFIHEVGVGWYRVIDDDRGWTVARPSSWSWNADAIFIGGWVDINFAQKIDYIGLLTKDNSNIPYCTDGPGDASSPSTYRTVDNGKTCYWRVDCEAYSGNGWTGTDSKKMGPFVSVPICDCETDTNNCGDGVCGPVTLNEQNYRFDNVRCVYGGWMGNLVKI